MHCVAGCVLSFVFRCALFVVPWSLYVVRSCNGVLCVAFCWLLFAVGVASLFIVVGCLLLLSCVVCWGYVSVLLAVVVFCSMLCGIGVVVGLMSLLLLFVNQ